MLTTTISSLPPRHPTPAGTTLAPCASTPPPPYHLVVFLFVTIATILEFVGARSRLAVESLAYGNSLNPDHCPDLHRRKPDLREAQQVAGEHTAGKS